MATFIISWNFSVDGGNFANTFDLVVFQVKKILKNTAFNPWILQHSYGSPIPSAKEKKPFFISYLIRKIHKTGGKYV